MLNRHVLQPMLTGLYALGLPLVVWVLMVILSNRPFRRWFASHGNGQSEHNRHLVDFLVLVRRHVR